MPEPIVWFILSYRWNNYGGDVMCIRVLPDGGDVLCFFIFLAVFRLRGCRYSRR
jgi:hypothetical protein